MTYVNSSYPETPGLDTDLARGNCDESSGRVLQKVRTLGARIMQTGESEN